MDHQPVAWQPQNTIRGTYLALATFLSTACIGVVVKWLPGDTSPMTIGFVQFFIVLLLTLPWVLRTNPTSAPASKLQNLKTQRLALHLLRGISGLLAHLCFYVAIFYVPLVDANLLLSAAPIWVPLLLLIFMKQAVPRALWISILTGFLGVGFILHPNLQTFNRGVMYGLLSGIMLAIALITVRALASTEPPARQLFYYALFSSIICFPFVMLHWRTIHLSEFVLLASAGLFLFSQQCFLVKALRYINAGLLSPMSYFTIVFAGLFGWLIWSEAPDIRSFIGVALVLLSGLLTVVIGKRQEIADTPGSTTQMTR